VRDAEVAALLGARLQARGVEVVAAPLRELDEALDAVLGQMLESPAAAKVTTPGTWRETGASREELAEFHHAAAEFHRLAPWKNPETLYPLLLAHPDGAQWGASVMGEAGMAYGLALHSNPGDLAAMLVSEPTPGGMPELVGYQLTVDLDERDALTRPMQREITAAGWTIAGPRAYPRLFAMNVPGRQVTAEHVRQAIVALRAINAAARGRNPEAEAGVRVSPFLIPAPAWIDEDDDDLDYFILPQEAAPICAEGPGADPEGALRAWDAITEMNSAEEERLGRMTAWLKSGADTPDLEADLRNARRWTDGISFVGVPAGAVTEHDLRLFLYDYYPRKGKSTPEDTAALPDSLRRIFRFLEEREGIRYPFAAAVLDELEEVARQGEDDGMRLHETLNALVYEVYDDLDMRAMLHRRESLDGVVPWPDAMNADVAILDRELQRHWLLWYDAEVRQGTTDLDELEEALIDRQRTWENTPHPAHEGRTPADVVRAYMSSEAYVGQNWKELVD
jgi:hypothetical protein